MGLCLSADYPRFSQDSVVAMARVLALVRDHEYEFITLPDELKLALTRRIQQILRPSSSSSPAGEADGAGGDSGMGGSGGIRILSSEWLGFGDYALGNKNNREVYYSPKVSEQQSTPMAPP